MRYRIYVFSYIRSGPYVRNFFFACGTAYRLHFATSRNRVDVDQVIPRRHPESGIAAGISGNSSIPGRDLPIRLCDWPRVTPRHIDATSARLYMRYRMYLP